MTKKTRTFKRSKFFSLSFPVVFFFLLSLLPFYQAFPQLEDMTDILIPGKDTVFILDHDDIKKGERLFYGLLPLGENTRTCVSCHNIKHADILNWNPSALDIAISSSHKSLDEFENVLLNPTGRKMSEVHTNYNFGDEQVILLKGFMQEFYELGGIRPKPVIDRLLLFIGLLLLFILPLVDLLFTKIIRFKIIHFILIFCSLFFITKIIVIESISLGRQQNYAPLQPVKFSHKVHAGINGTDCLYCHHTAEYSKSAGIPPVNVCWNCHSIVREGTNSGKFEINKIVTAYEKTRKPIPWIRIHNLPDHVFFSHAQHVGAGKLACEECHGPVKEMDVMYQHHELSMGWCLDCHRTHRVQFMENNYYSIFKEYHEKIKSGLMDSVTVEQIGGTNCQRCHY